MGKRLLGFLLLGVGALLTGCLPVGTRTDKNSEQQQAKISGPAGNAEGFHGIQANPFNSAPRCGIRETSSSLFVVSCSVVVRDGNGKEWEATEIAQGTEFRWKLPAFIDGVPVKSLSCVTASSALAQTCEVAPVTVTATQSTRMEFGFQASYGKDTTNNNVTVALVTAQTYGLVPHLASFQPTYLSPSLQSRQVGFQSDSFDAIGTFLGIPYSICAKDGRVFYATRSSIFVSEGDLTKVRLYAGNPNPLNVDDLSSRTQVALSTGDVRDLHVACSSEGLVVSDIGMNRVLLIKDAGPVEVLYSGSRPSAIHLAADGMLYVASDGGMLAKIQLQQRSREDLKMSGLPGTPSSMAIAAPLAYFTVENQIFRGDLNTGVATLFAGTGESGNGGDGDVVEKARLRRPSLLMNGDGRLLVGDREGNVIRQIDLKTRRIDNWIGRGGFSFGCNRNETTSFDSTSLCDPAAFARDEAGDVYVVEPKNYLVRRLRTNNTTSIILNTLKSEAEELVKEEPLPQMSIGVAMGVGFMGDSFVLSDLFKNRLRVVSPAQSKVNNRAPEKSGLSKPRDLRVLADGSVIVRSEESIQKVLPNDTVVTMVASSGRLGGNRIQESTAADSFPLKSPGGIAVHTNGTLYFFEQGTLFSLAPQNGAEVKRVAGPLSGAAGFSGDGGSALNATFNSPFGVEVGADNTIYVADTGNNRVRRIDPVTQIVTTIAGSGKPGAVSKPGWADTLPLNQPIALRVRKNGEIYVADSQSRSIFVLSPRKQEDGSTRYWLSILVGGKRQDKMCSGQVGQNAADAQAGSSLETLCFSYPVALDLRESCAGKGGKVELLYSQVFDDFVSSGVTMAAGNLVKLTLPCDLAGGSR